MEKENLDLATQLAKKEAELDVKTQEKEDVEANLERTKEKLETEITRHNELKQRLSESDAKFPETKTSSVTSVTASSTKVVIPPPPAPPMAPPPPPGPPPPPSLLSKSTPNAKPSIKRYDCLLILLLKLVVDRNLSFGHSFGRNYRYRPSFGFGRNFFIFEALFWNKIR